MENTWDTIRKYLTKVEHGKHMGYNQKYLTKGKHGKHKGYNQKIPS